MRHNSLDPPCCVAESQKRWLSLLRSGQVLAYWDKEVWPHRQGTQVLSEPPDVFLVSGPVLAASGDTDKAKPVPPPEGCWELL